MIGESASADLEEAEKYPVVLGEIVERENYIPKWIFNVNVTGLFWKRMQTPTSISMQEKTASGFKAAKDHRTLLLIGIATGELKLKPLLIYQSETPWKVIVKSIYQFIDKVMEDRWYKLYLWTDSLFSSIFHIVNFSLEHILYTKPGLPVVSDFGTSVLTMRSWPYMETSQCPYSFTPPMGWVCGPDG